MVDNFDDIDRLEQLATRPQHVLIRIIPGINAQTHESQSTGGDDSKFGLPLDQAREAITRIRASDRLVLDGLHLHIGSQIFDIDQFAQAVEAIAVLGIFPVYDVGGGLGVRYTRADDAPSVERYLDAITSAAPAYLPAGAKLVIEPGRSLVARSGATLYRVTTVKHTGRTFVAVDGGMADNLDASLTGQPFEAALATRMGKPPTRWWTWSGGSASPATGWWPGCASRRPPSGTWWRCRSPAPTPTRWPTITTAP